MTVEALWRCSDEELLAAIRDNEQQRRTVDAQTLALVGEVENRRLAGNKGLSSPPNFFCQLLNISRRRSPTRPANPTRAGSNPAAATRWRCLLIGSEGTRLLWCLGPHVGCLSVRVSNDGLSINLAAGSAERPTEGGEKPQIIVTTSLEDLRREGIALLGAHYLPITGKAARRLACDAQVIPAVLGATGEVLDIARAHQAIPVGIRRAVTLRDQGCCPGCGVSPMPRSLV